MTRILILLLMCFGEIRSNTTQNDFEIDDRIVGGQRCSVADHKYMVAIVYTKGGSFLCGGTLLSARWVLTARHCIGSSVAAKTFTVIAGVEAPAEKYWGKYVQSSEIEKLYDHPTDDISLINLKKSFKVSPLVGFVKLATYSTMQGRKLEDICSNGTVMGWGLHNPVEADRMVTSRDPYLQCLTNLSVITPQDCYNRLKPSNKRNVSESNFCAFKKDADACMGDSGGPFMCHGIQYGIVSYGYGCASKEYPGMYVKVFYFENFIKSTMKKGNNEISKNQSCANVSQSFMVAIVPRNMTGKIQHQYTYTCAGSMVSKTWVLTSGYCTTNCEIPNYYSVAGGLKDSFKFDPKDKGMILRKVAKCYQCPTHSEHQDIVLMKLKNEFKPSMKVSIIRFATLLDMKNTKFKKVCSGGTLVGYTRPKNDLYHSQCVQTKVATNKHCKPMWSVGNIGIQHGCIVGPETSDCYTTLGAPLVCHGMLYGVLSSIACPGRSNPNSEQYLVAKVYKYDAFMQKMVYNKNVNETRLWKSKGNMKNSVNLYIFTFYFGLFVICVL